jgi:hypothetical protein
MTQETLERKVKAIGEYLNCNEDELWSEMKILINSHVKEVIGEDEKMPSPVKYNDRPRVAIATKNLLRAEQRLRAGLSEKGSK